jgi:hypothetical protein
VFKYGYGRFVALHIYHNAARSEAFIIIIIVVDSCFRPYFPIWVHEGGLKYDTIKQNPEPGKTSSALWLCYHLNRCFHLLGGELAGIKKEKKRFHRRGRRGIIHHKPPGSHQCLEIPQDQFHGPP